jgi:predicted ribosomally synthesized peptide with SipW-like signal peptide
MSRKGEVAEETKRRRRSRLLALFLIMSLAVVSLGSGAVTLALFTDQQTVAGNTFTAGTVTLGANPASALITYSAMAPGDVVTAPLTVTNTGTLALRYSGTSLATNADTKGLAAALVLVIKSGVTTCTTAGFGTDGTAVYTGILGAVAPAPATKLFGDSASGQQAGDRPLAASANEVLCFQATLPITTGNALQASTTTATFTFDAEQTKNN